MFKFLKNISLFLVIAIIAFFLQCQTSRAQTFGSIDLYLSPETPEPGQSVVVNVSGQLIDINNSKIYWYIDGSLKKQGVGETKLSFTVKEAGKTTNIKVKVITADDNTLEKSVIVNPSNVDLITETTSYTPPFYKGKGYFVNQGKVRIIAIPNIYLDGQKVSVNNLYFKWSKDNTILGSDSGMGKNTMVINGSVPINDILVSLEVLDSNKNPLAYKSILLSPTDPEIIFYEVSPLYGKLFNKAIYGTYSLGNREEIKFSVEPYFFDVKSNIASNINYSWSVDNKQIDAGGKKNEILLRQQSTGAKGAVGISVEASNLTRIFQYTNNFFNIEYGQ